jgi:hypothetical protein
LTYFSGTKISISLSTDYGREPPRARSFGTIDTFLIGA